MSGSYVYFREALTKTFFVIAFSSVRVFFTTILLLATSMPRAAPLCRKIKSDGREFGSLVIETLRTK
jgi:hypothetical protein